jgi:hypothetical protein
MRESRLLRFARLASAELFLLLAAVPALAQSCSLCYTQAASAGARMIAALQIGIVILVVPPTLASIGMIFIVHHRRNQFRQADDAPDADRDW